jgi:hypothetical protein
MIGPSAMAVVAQSGRCPRRTRPAWRQIRIAHLLGVTNAPDTLGKIIGLDSFGTVGRNAGIVRDVLA